MKRILPALLCILLCNTAALFAQEHMTPDRFKELVATPGDSTVLMTNLTLAGGTWTNAQTTVDLKYANGKTFHETCHRTAKTIQGKYIVFSIDSKYYNRTMNSILTYDDQSSIYRIWGLYNDTVVGGVSTIDPEKHLVATYSTYGDGFMELGTGQSTEVGASEHVCVYQKGILVLTRDAQTIPINN